MKRFMSFIITFAAMPAAFAHEGHGDHTHGGYTITHYFVEPEHLVALVAGVAVVMLLVNRFRKATSNK